MGRTQCVSTYYLHVPCARVQRERWGSPMFLGLQNCWGPKDWFVRTVQLWKNGTVSWRYFPVIKTASNCWISIFYSPTRVWSKFEYHNMDLFEAFVWHWGVFMCRWVHCSYCCIIFTLEMKMQKIITTHQLQNPAVRDKIWCVAFPMFVLQSAALKFLVTTF